jgi:hypothetical protein
MDTGFRRYDGLRNEYKTVSGSEAVVQHETRNPKLKTNSLSDLRPRRLGRKQNIHQLIKRRFSLLVHFFDLDRADGMLHHQHGMIRRTESFLFGLCQCGEGVGDQRDREPSALLDLE